MPEITIIMPTLNVAKYIESCLRSVINQSFDNLEVLIIDAGSTDGTLEILQKYAKRDKRINLLHSERRSYGYQINMGIRLAKGRFVGVVETDDYIERDMYEFLYKAIISGDYDYVKGTAQTFREIGSDIVVTTEITCTPNGQTELNPCEHPELFVTDRFLWLGLYKAEFIKKIELNETPGAAYQDIGFIYQTLHKASKALYLNRTVYHYRQDNQNASGYNSRAFHYLYDEYRKLLGGSDSEEWLQAIYRKLAEQSLGRFHNMALSGRFWSEYEEETAVIRKWLLEAVEKGYLTEEGLGAYNWKLLLAWKEEPNGAYSQCQKAYAKKMEKLTNCFSQIGERRLLIFGAGKYGKFFHALCENRYPEKTTGYCDNNQELWKSKIQGKKVYAPAEAVRLFPEAAFVITISKEAEQAEGQLLELGIEKSRIVCFRPDMDYLLLNTKY